MKLLYIIATLVPFYSYGASDTTSANKSQIVKKELVAYIDSIKKDSHPSDRNDMDRFDVFVARFYHSDADKKDFSFTLGYIVNSSEYDFVKANYYMEIGKEVVLFRLPDNDFVKELGELGMKKFEYGNDPEEIKIIQKLYPNVGMRYIANAPAEITVHLKNNILQSTYHTSDTDSFVNVLDMSGVERY